MSKCKKLLDEARAGPDNLRFTDLCRLAECYGFVQARQQGSHIVYKRPDHMDLMVFQNRQGKAVAYQVKQLLRAIEELDF